MITFTKTGNSVKMDLGTDVHYLRPDMAISAKASSGKIYLTESPTATTTFISFLPTEVNGRASDDLLAVAEWLRDEYFVGITLQSTGTIDLGDVTVLNGTGNSAVNIRDGGNSITVDAPVEAPLYVSVANGQPFVSTVNSSTATLLAGATFTGTWEEAYLYPSVVMACKSDQAGTLYIDFSPDGTNSDSTLSFTVAADINEVHRITVTRKYYRVRYTNGVVNQGYFRLQTSLGSQGTLTSPLNGTIQSDADSLITRSALIGQTELGEYDYVKVTQQGELYTSIKDPLTAFGEIQVAENTAFIQGTGVYEFIPTNFREYTYASGTTGITDRMFATTCGTTLYGYGAIQSFRSLNYKAGQGGLARFTAVFAANAANHWSGVGLINLSDELSFGYNGTTFGIWYRSGGVAECRTITVTGGSGGSTNLTLTLNTVAYTIPLTAGTTAHNAYEIAAWLNNTSNQAVWQADQIGATVIIIAQSDGAKSGTYSFSHATATGSIVQNKAGVAKTSTHIPKADWNVNTFADLDPSKGNIYQVQYQYLGFGNIFFSVENPDTGKFQLAHIIKYANANTTPSLRQPALRFGMYSSSQGSTTDIAVYCASVACFVQGKLTKTRNPRAVKHTQSVTTSLTNVLTIRNRKSYNSITNQVEIEPQNITIASESSQSVEIEIRSNATFSGDTNFANAGTNLVGDVDTTANTVSNGTLLTAFTLGSKGNLSANLSQYEIAVPPSLTLTIAAKVVSGASSNVTAALTYYEDL